MEYDLYDNELFVSNLDRFHYACDEFEMGMFKRSREIAIRKRYLDPNTKNKIWALVFDIDRPHASVAWYDAGMPEPNWVCQNPKNGHAHLGYALATPVSRSVNSRGKPQNSLARIEHAMSKALRADPAYSHRLTKNPLNDTHRTFYGRRDAYDFEELRGYLPAYLPLVTLPEITVGEGRNVSLFTNLRQWAYRARSQFPDFRSWLDGCFNWALTLNGQFRAPLPLSEVKATAKSVATWTWEHMTGKPFSEVQARRSARGLVIRRSNQMDLAYKVMQDIL